MNEMPKELELLEEWLEILNLKDWFISLKTECEPNDLTLDYADGEVQYEEVSRSAEIRILKKEYSKGFRAFNFEEILVHELLHLKLCLLAEGEDWENSLQLRVLHQQIDDLARSFVTLKRRDEQKNGC